MNYLAKPTKMQKRQTLEKEFALIEK